MIKETLCKYFGHNYCPGKISLTGTFIVNIELRCRRCGRIYRISYPSTWSSGDKKFWEG